MVACNSSDAERALVMSTMTNLDRLASSRTVSMKSLVSGLSKLKTIGTNPKSRSLSRSRSRTIIRPSVQRPNRSTPFLPMMSMSSRIFSLCHAR
jgi:hypothetical protein